MTHSIARTTLTASHHALAARPFVARALAIRALPLLLALVLPAVPLATASASMASTPAPIPDADAARAVILDLLRAQTMAWNRGDLDAFCAVYADDAVFVTPKGMVRGRDAVLARYRTRYPDVQAMGTLALEPLEWRFALDDAQRVRGVSVVARWALAYDQTESREGQSGLTLIVFLPKEGGWQIVQDASM